MLLIWKWAQLHKNNPKRNRVHNTYFGNHLRVGKPVTPNFLENILCASASYLAITTWKYNIQNLMNNCFNTDSLLFIKYLTKKLSRLFKIIISDTIKNIKYTRKNGISSEILTHPIWSSVTHCIKWELFYIGIDNIGLTTLHPHEHNMIQNAYTYQLRISLQLTIWR